MSLLASIAFVLAAIVVVAALRSTIGQFGDVALANIAALRDCGALREFRVRSITVIARPVATGEVRRITTRGSARRVTRPERLLAAA